MVLTHEHIAISTLNGPLADRLKDLRIADRGGRIIAESINLILLHKISHDRIRGGETGVPNLQNMFRDREQNSLFPTGITIELQQGQSRR